jgi:hypothetical protein
MHAAFGQVLDSSFSLIGASAPVRLVTTVEFDFSTNGTMGVTLLQRRVFLSWIDHALTIITLSWDAAKYGIDCIAARNRCHGHFFARGAAFVRFHKATSAHVLHALFGTKQKKRVVKHVQAHGADCVLV